MTFGTWREEFEDWGRKEKKEKNLNHSTGNVGIRGLGSNIFPMIRPDKQMSTRKERHVYAMQFQEPWILTNSRADYQLLKTRGRAGPWLSSSPFRSTNETPLPRFACSRLPRTQSENTIVDFNSIRVARFNWSRTNRSLDISFFFFFFLTYLWMQIE